MVVTRLGISAIVCSLGISQTLFASSQSDSAGFTEDSHLKLNIRNAFVERNMSGRQPVENYYREWSQALTGVFESGYTQGVVGFGADVIAGYGLKLDASGGSIGYLEYDSQGPKGDLSRFGTAAKVRISNTVVKIGDQFIALPILSTSDSKALPQTARGVTVTSKEISNLTLNAGHMNGLTNRNQSNYDTYRLKSLDYAGGTYNFNDYLSGLSTSLYYARTDDFYEKRFLNLNYVQPLSSSQSLTYDANFYRTKSIGLERLGEKDNLFSSYRLIYNVAAHTFTLGYMGLTGKGNWNHGPDGDGTYWVWNSMQVSDFNHEDEKTLNVRYDYDFAAMGYPGLRGMLRTAASHGYKDGFGNDINGRAIEHDIAVTYVVQSGAAKGLNFTLLGGHYRSTVPGTDADEIRFTTNLPFNVF